MVFCNEFTTFISKSLHMEISYASIKSLIVSEELEGNMIKLKFQAPGQPSPLETVAVIMPDQNEIMAKAMKQAAISAAANTGVNMASSALGNLIGGIGGSVAQTAGSMAGSAAVSSSLNSGDLLQTEVTDEKREAAIVQAFSYFQVYYTWDGIQWQYKLPSA